MQNISGVMHPLHRRVSCRACAFECSSIFVGSASWHSGWIACGGYSGSVQGAFAGSRGSSRDGGHRAASKAERPQERGVISASAY